MWVGKTTGILRHMLWSCVIEKFHYTVGEILLISYREKYLKGARKGGLEEGVGKGRK